MNRRIPLLNTTVQDQAINRFQWMFCTPIYKLLNGWLYKGQHIDFNTDHGNVT